MKIIPIILFIQLFIFNLNAADNSKYINQNTAKYSYLDLLPLEMLYQILDFIADPNTDLKLQTLEKIKNLKILVLINKEFNKFARNILKKYEKKTNKYLDDFTKKTNDPVEAALDLKTPFAVKWLKNKTAENYNLKQEIDKYLINNIKDGYKENIKFLINAHANINTQDQDGCTALMWAAGYGHENIVKMLIKANANLNIKNRWGHPALRWASANRYTNIVKMLINAGAKLNIQDDHKITTLMAAARIGHTDIVKTLIEAGAKLNIQDCYGYTALILAATNGHTNIVKMLIKAHADLNIQHNMEKETALITATKKGYADIVKILINANANINIKDQWGNKAYVWAAAKRYNNITEMLRKTQTTKTKL